jgi:hypothetical protein
MPSPLRSMSAPMPCRVVPNRCVVAVQYGDRLEFAHEVRRPATGLPLRVDDLDDAWFAVVTTSPTPMMSRQRLARRATDPRDPAARRQSPYSASDAPCRHERMTKKPMPQASAGGGADPRAAPYDPRRSGSSGRPPRSLPPGRPAPRRNDLYSQRSPNMPCPTRRVDQTADIDVHGT